MVTKEEVKNAMEYKWRGDQVKTYLCLWGGILLFMAVAMVGSTVARGVRDWSLLGTVMAVVGGVYSLAILPFAFYAGYRQWEMLRNCARFEKYRVKLDEPSTSWSYRQSISYRVVFEREGKIARQTKPVVSGSAFSQFPLSDYNNKTVDIFYDPERDEVILAGNAK